MKSSALLLSPIIFAFNPPFANAAESKPPTPITAPAPPRKATASQLIEDAKRALAFIGKTAKESNDNSLDLKNVRQQPFWSALKKTEQNLVGMETELKTHDVEFFDLVNESTQRAAELRGALPRSGIKNPKIENGVKSLCNALILLRKNYGVEALRKKQGGTLTEQELAEFLKLKDAEKTLVTQLESLLTDVKANPQLTTELNRLIAQLQKSIKGPLTVDELNAALELVDVVDGEWEAYSYYVDPKNRKFWQNARVAESRKAINTLSKDSLQDIVPSDWSYLDESADVLSVTDAGFEIEVNEVDGYVAFITESVNGIDLEVYYETVTSDEIDSSAIEEMSDE